MVLRDNVEDELGRWARNWLEKFMPFTNFLRLLGIPSKSEVEEHYAKLFGDAIIEALLSDKALGCKLVAKFSERGYVRCGNLYVQTRSSTRGFMGSEAEFKDFPKSIAGRLEVSYRYLVNLSVWGGEVIRASNLGKSLEGATIVGVHVWSYPPVERWSHVLTIIFNTPNNGGGDLVFAIGRAGTIIIYGTDALERRDAMSEAERDVLDHIPELDKALESLYTVVEVGFRGIVSYVLY